MFELGLAIDRLYVLRSQRLEAQRVVDGLKEEENDLRDRIIREMPKDTTGIAGHIARASRKETEVAQVEDWSEVYRYIKDNGSFELMQRRINNAAVKERWENGEQIPGVKKFTVVDLSLGKV